MVKNFNDIKKKELKIFFDMINPVVQNYMNEKSIDILFNSNHIFMGNKNSDLTNQLITDNKGNFRGSVSGGCIEGAVIEAAIKSINSGSPGTLRFEVSDEEAWEVGLACGGTIQVFVEKIE